MKNPGSSGFSLLLSLLLLLVSGGALRSQEKEEKEFQVAGVDLQRVYQEFYKVAKTEKDVNEERIRIQKADHKLRARLKILDSNLREESKKGQGESLPKGDKKIHDQKLKRLIDERNELNDERLQKYEESNTQLNEKMLVTMQGLLGEIHRFVESYAERVGYDIVFDTSGTSTNQTPFVLGGKGITDITASVISELNRESPSNKEKR